MGDCHYNPVNEDKFCKYSYASWCPACERSPPRRRSKSEVVECRRRCKDMKSPTARKYSRSQEYENMEFGLDYQEYWFEPPKDNFRYIRSSQLCELPTSYITNNCQSSKLSDYVKNYEPPVKMKQDDLTDVFNYKKTYAKRNAKDTIKQSINYYDNHLSFDTSTYFDKIRDSSSIQEKYFKEIESVRERITSWERSTVSLEQTNDVQCIPIIPKKFIPEKLLKEIGRTEKKIETGDRATKTQETGVKPRKVQVKTRKTHSGRIKRIKLPSPKLSARFTEPIELDNSGSEHGESDDGNADDESESSCESSSTSTDFKNGSTPSAGGDASAWPARPSLFPHIPPYIQFNTHDAQLPVKVPGGRRLFKWKLSTITPIVVRKTLINSGFLMVRNSNQWLGTWGKHIKSPMFKTLKEMQKLNHFPGTFQLGRKDRLWRNFQRLINKYGYREFGFLPQTFILPQELKILKQSWDYKSGNLGDAWIIKPPASARGVGIKVINKWSQLPKKTSLVVQRYIANPYLINGSKFDLRLYVLVTSFNPLRIYLYPDGLARFASTKYSDDTKDLKDRYMHLTNYSINKLSSQYTANEDANACQGHKWTITKLLEYLSKGGVDVKSLWRNLQQLVIKTIITAESPINQLCEENMLSRYNCYELFGVDVLLDEFLKPWLLEVNISPSLHSASPLDAHVKGPLVQMLFDLAQFHFPPRLAQTVQDSPPCYDPKLYTTALTKREREKHTLFSQYETRLDYLDEILENLTGDDVRKLTQAEDEFSVKGRFERIFPTSQTHKYLNYMDVRYYNRLFDAWECHYEKNRMEGVERLRELCHQKVHLKVAPQNTLAKSSPNLIPGCSSQPSKEGQTRPINEIFQEVTIEPSPSCNEL